MRNLILAAACLLALAGAAFAEVAPGDKAPDFTLTDTAGAEHSLADYLAAGKTVVLEWFNPDCPFIRKHHLDAKTMNESWAAVKDHDVVWLAVNSNAPGKQGAGLERNRRAVEEYGMPFPVLLDEAGDVGRAYGAKTTPHMFVITGDGTVVYNGAIDDNPSPTTLGETNHVLAALHAVMQGKEVPQAATRPYGCSVKYAQK